MPRDFDTWNTRENFLSQIPRKAFQERLILVYLVFTCYWRQICYTQLSKPSPNLRSWAPLLIYDATVMKWRFSFTLHKIQYQVKDINNEIKTTYTSEIDTLVRHSHTHNYTIILLKFRTSLHNSHFLGPDISKDVFELLQMHLKTCMCVRTSADAS